jgi:hypothetical protein
MEYVPSKEINLIISSLSSTLKINQQRLSNFLKPFDLLKSLDLRISKKRKEIDAEKDEPNKRRLIIQLKTLEDSYKDAQNLITPELEKKVEFTRDSIKQNEIELNELNKKLDESLEYEKLLDYRNSTTIVDTFDVSTVIGSIDQIVINKGQKSETLTSISNGNIYIKLSLLESSESMDIIKKSVNYNNVMIVENNDFIEVANFPKIPQSKPIKDFSPTEVRGDESIYLSQTFSHDVTMYLNTSVGFILLDSDRRDGELSVWVLTQLNNKVRPVLN